MIQGEILEGESAKKYVERKKNTKEEQCSKIYIH